MKSFDCSTGTGQLRKLAEVQGPGLGPDMKRLTWTWAEPREVCAGDYVTYWKCGDDLARSVVLPQPGEVFYTSKPLPTGEDYPWDFVDHDSWSEYQMDVRVGVHRYTYRMKEASNR